MIFGSGEAASSCALALIENATASNRYEEYIYFVNALPCFMRVRYLRARRGARSVMSLKLNAIHCIYRFLLTLLKSTMHYEKKSLNDSARALAYSPGPVTAKGILLPSRYATLFDTILIGVVGAG